MAGCSWLRRESAGADPIKHSKKSFHSLVSAGADLESEQHYQHYTITKSLLAALKKTVTGLMVRTLDTSPLATKTEFGARQLYSSQIVRLPDVIDSYTIYHKQAIQLSMQVTESSHYKRTESFSRLDFPSARCNTLPPLHQSYRSNNNRYNTNNLPQPSISRRNPYSHERPRSQ